VVELAANGSGGYAKQITLPFIGLGDPEGVAVDSTGDVYVVDFVGGGNGNGEVLELPANGSGGFGSQQALPFSGLLDPEGIAVDSAGDVGRGEGVVHRPVRQRLLPVAEHRDATVRRQSTAVHCS
jgi:serine/threonine protein kinase, bacterial